GVAGGLQQLKGDDEIGLPLVDDGGVYLVAEADVGNHAAAPLAHTVDFGHLHVIALVQQQTAQQLAGQQGTLAAHAYDHNIFRIHVHTSSPVWRASNLHSCWHTPQPTHRVASTPALPSVTEMAGQPIFMQALQPTHLP